MTGPSAGPPATTPRAGLAKRRVRAGAATVAYLDEGPACPAEDGAPPLLLLHGCPFSSFVWRKVIAELRDRFRCVAPDLLGLGDTETPPGADWSLPAQAATVVGVLDALGIEQADVVAHDHGAATAQLIAAEQPRRIGRLVLANAEAYDNWPSRDELPFVRATQLPVLGRLVLWAWARPGLFRYALRSGKAVHDPSVLTAELLDGYIAANLADARRRAKTRRFLAGAARPRQPPGHRRRAGRAAGFRPPDPDRVGRGRPALRAGVGPAAARGHPRCAAPGAATAHGAPADGGTARRARPP